MQPSSVPPPSSDDLQFDVVEPVVPMAQAAMQAPTCIGCRLPIRGQYYALRDKIVCPQCLQQLNAPPAGSPVTRVAKATVMGIGAGLLGAVAWYLLRRYAHLEIGLVAIAVGYMVGKAVRNGSGDRGGRGYQILAVLITYICIAANFVPDLLEGMLDQYHQDHSAMTTDSGTSPPGVGADGTATTPADGGSDDKMPPLGTLAIMTGVAFATSLTVPFYGGLQDIIGLLIISFALWAAWKFNRRRVLPITGPYQLATPGSVPNAAALPMVAPQPPSMDGDVI